MNGKPVRLTSFCPAVVSGVMDETYGEPLASTCGRLEVGKKSGEQIVFHIDVVCRLSYT
jgi:hypothetical protein